MIRAGRIRNAITDRTGEDKMFLAAGQERQPRSGQASECADCKGCHLSQD